jgi:hypothetical protein
MELISCLRFELNFCTVVIKHVIVSSERGEPYKNNRSIVLTAIETIS